MKIHPQILYTGQQPAFVVLQMKEYKQLLKAAEDATDIKEVQEYMADPEETFPLSIVKNLAEGKNPIQVYRRHRGLTQTALADEIGVTRQYISQLEKGERTGTVKILRAIAKVLNVDLEDIG